MCSWCWGFRPTWDKLKTLLADRNVPIRNVLGGLAPDTDKPMPIAMQQQIQSHWYRINEYLGTEFNFDFWIHNQPRRATYPACRAVLAARLVGQSYLSKDSNGLVIELEEGMIDAIQRAYYLKAMNPSDASVLTLVFDDLLSKFTLPAELTREFIRIFRDHSTHLELLNEIKLSRTLSNEGFPALVLQHDSTYHAISLDYKNPCTMLEQINACIAV
jgi:putative protein-disulfide isomerase